MNLETMLKRINELKEQRTKLALEHPDKLEEYFILTKEYRGLLKQYQRAIRKNGHNDRYNLKRIRDINDRGVL